MGSSPAAQRSALAARFDRGEIARLTAWRLVSDPIHPSMKREKGSALEPRSELVDGHARPQELSPGNHSVRATRDTSD